MDEQSQARRFLVDAVSDYSEEQYAAGWLVGVENTIRAHGGMWTLLAWLASGWPRLSDRRPGDDDDWYSLIDWEPLTATEIAAAHDFFTALNPVPPRYPPTRKPSHHEPAHTPLSSDPGTPS